MNRLKTLSLALIAAVPFASLLAGCNFERNDGVLDPPPLTSAIFCDIEVERRCATNDDIIIGINRAKPFEDGFWANKSSRIGLDYGPHALDACGGGPEAVVFLDAFPNGTPVCLKPDAIPAFYPGPGVACNDFCMSLGLPVLCIKKARESNGSQLGDANGMFAGACTEAGTWRADFADPRKVPPLTPVVWTALVGVDPFGPGLNDLKKSDLAAPGWGSQDPQAAAGAISVQQLTVAKGGFVQITVAESNSLRIFGLGNGTSSTTFEDIDHGLLLTQAGTLLVRENAQFTNVGSYKTGDTLSVGIENGTVVYKQRPAGTDTFNVLPAPAATSLFYPLVVKVAFNFNGATITGAQVTF